MAVKIPEAYHDLLEEPVVVAFATIMPDGQPQVTPVWADWDGEYVLINTAKGRQKHTNVENNPRVNVLAIDPENPYRYLEVRGIVEEIVEEDSTEHIDKLAKLYVGKDKYYGGVAPAEMEGQEVRVMYKIKPIDLSYQGS